VKARHATLAAAAALILGASIAGIPAAAGGIAKTKSVQVLDDFYKPTKVNVHKGDRVKWTWGSGDIDRHSVTLTSGPKGVKIADFRSPTKTSGTFKRKFAVKGTYKFHCTVHPTSMKMQVVVAG